MRIRSLIIAHWEADIQFLFTRNLACESSLSSFEGLDWCLVIFFAINRVDSHVQVHNWTFDYKVLLIVEFNAERLPWRLKGPLFMQLFHWFVEIKEFCFVFLVNIKLSIIPEFLCFFLNQGRLFINFDLFFWTFSRWYLFWNKFPKSRSHIHICNYVINLFLCLNHFSKCISKISLLC